MHALSTRVTPLLMAVLMFTATGLPVAADPEDNGDGWGDGTTAARIKRTRCRHADPGEFRSA